MPARDPKSLLLAAVLATVLVAVGISAGAPAAQSKTRRTTTTTAATTTTTAATTTTTTVSGTGVLLGDQNVESTTDGSSGSASEAFGYTASASGTATSISIYLQTTDGVHLALYSDNAAHPANVLDQGSVASNTAGWTTVHLSGGVQVNSGSRYWLAIGSTGGGANVTYRDKGNGGTSLDYSGTGFASPYASNGQWTSNPASVYLNGTLSGPPLTTTTTGTTTTTMPTTTTTTTQPPPPPPGMLPGEFLQGPNKVPNFVFGTVDQINYGNPNVETIPSVQNYIAQGEPNSLLRIWVGSDETDAAIQARINLLKVTHEHCMVQFPDISNPTFTLHALSLLVPAGCRMFTLVNEADLNGITLAQYESAWDSQVPQYKAAYPGTLWGGPEAPYVEAFVQNWLQHIGTTGVQPDFVDYHDYPCYGIATKADCIGWAPTAYGNDINTVRGWEQQYLGHLVPTGITEYNFDPGSGNLYNWASDGAFMYQWEEAALQSFITNHYDFATEFTSLNYGAYGNLDMFSDSAPYGPKGQFWGLVDMGEKNGSGSTLVVPNPCC